MVLENCRQIYLVETFLRFIVEHQAHGFEIEKFLEKLEKTLEKGDVVALRHQDFNYIYE
jgi:hypothetical protein